MKPKMCSTLDEMEKYMKTCREPVDWTIPEDSPMVNFYRGKSVFLTGGTGFLGQLFVEKLLRTGAKKIYVLARPKKGKGTKERLSETYSGHVFARLSSVDPEYMDRVQPVEGNMQDLQLGISDADRLEIIENVQIVIHSAADVRFDETLQNLLLVNLRGTREVLRLAEQIRGLQICIHISTAYSHCPRDHIRECFYESPMDPEKMIRLAESIEGVNMDQVQVMTEQLIRPWPNTYTYTKALSEELVRSFGSKFPIAVIRPTIVIATYADPIPGWINNIYGLTGVLVSTGLGFQRILPYKREIIGDIVCADFVINSTLSVGWVTHEEKKDTAPFDEPKIYNISSFNDSPVTYGEVADRIEEIFYEIPTEKVLWIPTVNVTNYAVLEFVYTILYHVIPSIFFDVIFKIWGTKFRLLPMYRKVQKFMQANAYFMTRQWSFDNDAVKTVYDKMSPEDKRFFPGDVRTYNFHKYSNVYYLGMRAYIMNEVFFDLPRAVRKVRLMRWGHAVVLVVFYGTMASIIYGVSTFYGFNYDWAMGYVKMVT